MIREAVVPLTTINNDIEALRRKTVPGMAHWAGSGPDGKTCLQCVHWTGCGDNGGYHARGGKHGGLIKPRACEKYRDLMRGVGPKVPDSAAACRHFEESTNPPDRFAK